MLLLSLTDIFILSSPAIRIPSIYMILAPNSLVTTSTRTNWQIPITAGANADVSEEMACTDTAEAADAATTEPTYECFNTATTSRQTRILEDFTVHGSAG